MYTLHTHTHYTYIHSTHHTYKKEHYKGCTRQQLMSFQLRTVKKEEDRAKGRRTPTWCCLFVLLGESMLHRM